MPDQYGATTLPVPVPPDDQRIGDPLLFYVGDFLKTVGNAHGGDAWQSVAPGDKGPISTVFQDNPLDRDTPVDDNSLPAIWIWRGDITGWAQIAEDIRVVRSPINLLWVAQSAQAETWIEQLPFWQALFKTFDAAIDLGRDPSWVVPGDTYYFPERRGSSLAHWAKYRKLYPSKGDRTPLQVKLADGGDNPPPLAAYTFILNLEETLVRDNAAHFFEAKGVRGSLVSKADPSAPVGTASFEFKTKT